MFIPKLSKLMLNILLCIIYGLFGLRKLNSGTHVGFEICQNA